MVNASELVRNEKSESRLNKKDYLHLLILIVIWSILIIVIHPQGDFPLIDDWAYAYAVKNLLNGVVLIHPWAYPSQIAHDLWGSLFAHFWTFSFDTLRISELILSLGCIPVFYDLLRVNGAASLQAFWLSLCLIVNPLFLLMSCTFMTDISFIFLLLISLSLYCRAIRNDLCSYLLAATFFALASSMVRQVGILLPQAFLFCRCIYSGVRSRETCLAMIYAAIVDALFVYLTHYLKGCGLTEVPLFGGNGNDWTEQFVPGFGTLHNRMIESMVYIGTFLIMCGFYFAPIVIQIQWSQLIDKWKGYALSCFALFSVWAILHFDFFLQGAYCEPWSGGLFLTPIGVVICTFFVSFSMLILWHLLDSSLKTKSLISTDQQRSQILFIAVVSFLYIVSLLVLLCTSALSERYDLVIFLLMSLLLVNYRSKLITKEKKGALVVASAAALLIAIFSVSAIHNYFGWNRIRWQLLQDALKADIPADEIDGGFEFAGFYNYVPNFHPQYGRNVYWGRDNLYLISQSRIPGYEVFRKAAYRSWFPFTSNVVYLLQLQNQHTKHSLQEYNVPKIELSPADRSLLEGLPDRVTCLPRYGIEYYDAPLSCLLQAYNRPTFVYLPNWNEKSNPFLISPKTTIALLANYEPVRTKLFSGTLFRVKRERDVSKECLKNKGTQKLVLNQWNSLPQSRHPLILSAKLKPTFLEFAWELLKGKQHPIRLDVLRNSGTADSYFIDASSLENGVLISEVPKSQSDIFSFFSNRNEDPVDSFKLVSPKALWSEYGYTLFDLTNLEHVNVENKKINYSVKSKLTADLLWFNLETVSDEYHGFRSIQNQSLLWPADCGTVVLTGWAIDQNAKRPADSVWYQVDDHSWFRCLYGTERKDVSKALNQSGNIRVGFLIKFFPSMFGPGVHRMKFGLLSSDNTFFECRRELVFQVK